LGGEDLFSNLLLVHAVCHNSIHYGNDRKLWRDKLTIYRKSHPKKTKHNTKKDKFIQLISSESSKDSTILFKIV